MGRWNERIPDDERQAIADAIKAGGTCRGIAEQFKRSPGTVRNIAREFDITEPFARTQTARATAAKQIDNRARRVELAELLIEDAHRLRKQMWQKAKVYDFTKLGEYVEHELTEPPFGDKRSIAQSIRFLITSVTEMEKLDQGAGDSTGFDALWKQMEDGNEAGAA